MAQLDTKDFLFDRPGLFEVVLLPQIYNARRFDFGFADKPHIARIERSCLAMTEFQRAHPGAQRRVHRRRRDRPVEREAGTVTSGW